MIEDLTLTKVMPFDEQDLYAFEWLRQAVNPITQTLGSPADYKRDVVIHHLDQDGNPIDTWRYRGCYVKQVAYSNLDATTKTDKIIETVTLRVDFMDRS